MRFASRTPKFTVEPARLRSGSLSLSLCHPLTHTISFSLRLSLSSTLSFRHSWVSWFYEALSFRFIIFLAPTLVAKKSKFYSTTVSKTVFVAWTVKCFSPMLKQSKNLNLPLSLIAEQDKSLRTEVIFSSLQKNWRKVFFVGDHKNEKRIEISKFSTHVCFLLSVFLRNLCWPIILLFCDQDWSKKKKKRPSQIFFTEPVKWNSKNSHLWAFWSRVIEQK